MNCSNLPSQFPSLQLWMLLTTDNPHRMCAQVYFLHKEKDGLGYLSYINLCSTHFPKLGGEVGLLLLEKMQLGLWCSSSYCQNGWIRSFSFRANQADFDSRADIILPRFFSLNPHTYIHVHILTGNATHITSYISGVGTLQNSPSLHCFFLVLSCFKAALLKH